MIKHITMEEYKPMYMTYYVKELSKWIMDNYKCSEMMAYEKFVFSETYKMLSDLKCGMWEYGIGDIYDMWVAEQETGNPRNVDFLKYGA